MSKSANGEFPDLTVDKRVKNLSYLGDQQIWETTSQENLLRHVKNGFG